jgi:hypothetical protein
MVLAHRGFGMIEPSKLVRLRISSARVERAARPWQPAARRLHMLTE